MALAVALTLVSARVLWLEAAVARRDSEIAMMRVSLAKAETQFATARVEAEVAVAAANREFAARKTAEAMRVAPDGADACARVQDIDRRLQESLR